MARAGAGRSGARATDWALPAALAFVIVGSIMAVGGALTGVVVLFAPLAIGVGGWAAWSVQKQRRVPALAPTLILLGLGFYSVLQTVPLPLSLLSRVSPTGADIWARSLLPFGETVHRGSVSLDPGATWLEALKWTSYAAVLFSAAAIARLRGQAMVVATVAVASWLVAVSAIGHELVDARVLFGLYEPRNAPARFVAPLLNANNLAGFLVLGSLLTLGLLISKRPNLPRWLLASAVPVLAFTIFRSGSRGGVVALFVALLGFAALLVLRLRSTKRASERRPILLAGSLAAASVVIGAAFVFLDADRRLFRELANENTSKLRLFEWSRPLIADFPWVGVGRGAFESVFSAYRPAVGHHTIYTHPENFVVAWLSEWGLLVGGVALISLAWLFRPTRLGVGRSSLTAAVLCGLGALFLQNLVDLGLELFGVGVSVSALLGALWSRRARHRESLSRSALVTLVGGAAMAFISVVVLLSHGTTTLAQDRDAARAAFEATRSGARDLDSLSLHLQAQMRAHPADYYFPMLGAAAAIGERGGRPLAWIQRALERGPTVGRTHLVLSEALYRRGARKQALLEIRLACELEPGLINSAVPAALRYSRESSELLRAVPEGAPGRDFLEHLARSVPEDMALREALDRAALERDEGARGARERLVWARVDAWGSAVMPCEEETTCRAEIEAHASYFDDALPSSSLGAQVRARLSMAEGDPGWAVELLTPACERRDDRPACLRLLATAFSKLPGRDEEVGAALDELLRASCLTRESCASAHAWIAEIRAARREWGLAVNHRERACNEEPSETCFIALADAAEQAGALVLAADALEKAQRLRGSPDTSLSARISEFRRRAGQTNH